MNISFDLYNVFYYVCEFKSITKTANFLYVSQPAITKSIKNLEKHLGKTLITSNHQGIEITNDGKKLYNEIKTSVEKLNSIEASFKETGKNEEVIRIIAGYSTIKKLLLKTVSEFNKKYQNIRFEIGTYPYHESIQRLREGKADLIFLNMKEKDIEYNNISFQRLYTVHDILVVTKEIKKDFPDQIKLEDLNDYPVICKYGKSIARSNIESYFKQIKREFTPRYELSNHWLIEEYIRMNLGMGLITKEFILDDLKSGKLIEIKTDVPIPQREIGYATRKNAINYKILKEFIKEVKQKID